MRRKKSWNDKLHNSQGLPKIETIKSKMSKKWGIGTCVIPTPLDVDNLMKKPGAGELITINQIRSALAMKYDTSIACPLTTGIFAWVAANAADELARAGGQGQGQGQGQTITPYWRTLKTGGELNKKYPGGIENHKALLELEGHVVVKRGKRYFVENFENNLVSFYG
ncbi:MAG: MGMT family protein [Clostridiales bacterium]|nr:MGMT family protein [Clostridiales bacterium]